MGTTAVGGLVAPWRIGVDVGGTFTDLVLSFGDRTVSSKLLTTPDAPARAVIEGAGHLLPMEQPQALAKSLARWAVAFANTCRPRAHDGRNVSACRELTSRPVILTARWMFCCVDTS